MTNRFKPVCPGKVVLMVVGVIAIAGLLWLIFFANVPPYLQQAYLLQWRQRHFDMVYLLSRDATSFAVVITFLLAATIVLLIWYRYRDYDDWLYSHAWSRVWKYASEGTCLQRRRCRLCGRWAERQFHAWGEWRYRSENGCTQERRCQRCDQDLETRTEHDWAEWESGECDGVAIRARRCKRCATPDTDWGELWQRMI